MTETSKSRNKTKRKKRREGWREAKKRRWGDGRRARAPHKVREEERGDRWLLFLKRVAVVAGAVVILVF